MLASTLPQQRRVRSWFHSPSATQIEVFRSSPKKIYAYQHLIELFTKTAQSSGPESIGPERRFLGLSSQGPVLSPSRITLENNEKIRPQPDRENAFSGASGGETGIRTLETVSRLHTFQACAFDHSATSPAGVRIAQRAGCVQGLKCATSTQNMRNDATKGKWSDTSRRNFSRPMPSVQCIGNRLRLPLM
jgi:hypothetical protein